MMNRFARLRSGLLLAMACGCLGGCATSRQPWMEDGQRIGTIRRTKAPYGAECRYINSAGQLKRIEKRDDRDALLPGPSVQTFLYDSAGRISEERNEDATGSPTTGKEGYVARKYQYSTNDANDRVEEHSYVAGDNRPVCTTNGYALVRFVYEGAGDEVREVFLLNAQSAPASGLWEGVSGVAHVKYTTVQGVGDVRCGVYYDRTGRIVGRKAVKGTCYYSYTR